MVRALLFALALCVFPRTLCADFAFAYDADFDGGEFKAVVVLPDYFAHHFGLWDESFALLEAQKAAPLNADYIDTLRYIAQRWLWDWYVDQKILPKGFETDPKYATFVAAENLFDGRSAFVFVSDRHDLTKIHAMFRASSRILSDMDAPGGFRQYLPYELRAFSNPEFVKWWNLPRPTKVYWDLLEDAIYAFTRGPRRSVEGYLQWVNWFFGAQLELKNWAHKPQVVPAVGQSRRKVRDFMPLLIRLARLHKILSWTGHTIDRVPMNYPEAEKHLAMAVELASRMAKRPVSLREIGIRAGTYHLECVGQAAENRYQEEFGLVPSFHYQEALFPGQQTAIMIGEREVFDAKLEVYAAARPGAVLLPSTTLEFLGEEVPGMSIECARRMLAGVQDEFFDAYDVQSLSFGLMGPSTRPMR